MKGRFALALVLVILTVPCSRGTRAKSTQESSMPSASNGSTRDYYLGVIPTSKYYGNYTGKFKTNYTKDAIENAANIGEYAILSLGVDWYDIPDELKDGDVTSSLSWMDEYGVGAILQTSFWNASDIGAGKIRPTVAIPSYLPQNLTINETAFIDAWISHITNITAQVMPDFLVLSREVNEFWSYGDNPNSANNTFEDFLELCRLSTEAAHNASPSTQTIIEFELSSVVDRNQWTMIENVTDEHSDIIGFTSHPYLHGTPVGTMYPRPIDLPGNYYSQVRNHTALPIAFTDVGWSTGTFNDTMVNFTGSESDQSAFIDDFFNKVDDIIDISLVIWGSLHDTMPSGNETDLNQMTGIKLYNGSSKAAYDDWITIFERTYEGSSASSESDDDDDAIAFDPVFAWWSGLVLWIATIAVTVLVVVGVERWDRSKKRSSCGCSGRPGCDCDF